MIASRVSLGNISVNKVDICISQDVTALIIDKNDFDMPGIIGVDEAAKAIYKDMHKGVFDIHFPKGFTWTLKALSLLPFNLWRLIAKRMIKT